MIEKLGGRKFLLTLLVLSTATAIELLTARGITEWYAGLLIGIVGVYGASNVAITRKALTASEESASAIEVPASTQVSSQLEALQAEVTSQSAALAQVAETVSLTNQVLAAAARGMNK
jgi:hypothetical protein